MRTFVRCLLLAVVGPAVAAAAPAPSDEVNAAALDAGAREIDADGQVRAAAGTAVTFGFLGPRTARAARADAPAKNTLNPGSLATTEAGRAGTAARGPASAANQEMVDGDIRFNGVNHHGKAAGTLGNDDVDAQSIVTHEAGRFLGLAHSASPVATMYPSYEGGTGGRTLDGDDIEGLCAPYPAPAGSECSASRNVPRERNASTVIA